MGNETYSRPLRTCPDILGFSWHLLKNDSFIPSVIHFYLICMGVLLACMHVHLRPVKPEEGIRPCAVENEHVVLGTEHGRGLWKSSQCSKRQSRLSAALNRHLYSKTENDFPLLQLATVFSCASMKTLTLTHGS